MLTFKNVYVIVCIIIKVEIKVEGCINLLTTFLDINFHFQQSIVDTSGIESMYNLYRSLNINYYSEVSK